MFRLGDVKITKFLLRVVKIPKNALTVKKSFTLIEIFAIYMMWSRPVGTV